MLVTAKLKTILKLQESALNSGCSRAELILTRELKVDGRVRAKCRLNLCGQYDNNLLCPPLVSDFAPDVDILLAQYNFGMVMQITKPTDSKNGLEIFRQIKREIDAIILTLEQEAFRSGFSFAVGLSAGHCILCETCAAKEGSTICAYPEQARPSPEALGLNVEKLCRQVDFPAGFISGEVTVTGMLLID